MLLEARANLPLAPERVHTRSAPPEKGKSLPRKKGRRGSGGRRRREEEEKGEGKAAAAAAAAGIAQPARKKVLSATRELET